MKRIISLLILGMLSIGVYAQDNQEALENLAAQIAEKRSQVESLSNRLDLLKADYNEKLRSIGTQRADVETQIKREELSLTQVQRDIKEFTARIQENRASMEDIEPLVASVISQTRRYIRAGLPFQVEGRLKELDTLEQMLQEDKLDAGTVLARLWNTLESEFRLTRESGLYRQTIELNKEPQLAEVARLGMALMYFKTFDEEYGYVIPTPNGWVYTLADSREEEKQIEIIYDSLRKNLREGFFLLPNPNSKG